jgi:hypothetical protein
VSIVPARIKFLGVWDTVLALGLRVRARQCTTGHALAFHTSNAPPTNVDTIRHALAIGEQRRDFQPEIWQPSESLERRWFVGAHSKVGGGLADDSLANAALRWICQEASNSGLSFDDDFLKHYRASPVGRVQKKALTYKFIDTILKPVRGFNGMRKIKGGHATLDPSVFKRLNADAARHPELGGPYRPANLLKFLAETRRYDGELSPEVLEEVKRHR